jgi:hypothetical protein
LHGTSKARAVEVFAHQGTFSQHNDQTLLHQQPEAFVGHAVQTQLNVRESMYKPSFYEAVAKVMKLRQQYVEERFVFIKARDMKSILLGLGASEEDVARLGTVSNALKDDPTIPFRKTRNCRFCFDLDTKSVRRLEFQPFMLSEDEDFVRHDSGQVRRFDEIDNDIQLNSVFQALLVFKAMMVNGISIKARPKLEYDTNKWILTLFNTRTLTTPELLGEPALEGVHCDGVDHTMTMLLGSTNMAPNAAATFVHSMDETTGIKLREATQHKILGRVQHSELLDTVMIMDHERKHSLSAIYPEDKTKGAERDMLILFTRRPYTENHVAAQFDSLKPHPDLPMEIPLFIPGSS